mgnify:CR=1 FL=1
MQVSPKIADNVREYVKSDLEPSQKKVFAALSFAMIGGGFLSLGICGQLGLGLTTFSQSVYTILMTHTGMFFCSAICGSMFAIFPIGLLYFSCHPIFFRILMKKYFLLISALLLLIGILFAVISGHSILSLRLFLWFLGSISSFYLWAIFLIQISKFIYASNFQEV